MISNQNMLGTGIAAVLATTALAYGGTPSEQSTEAAISDLKWSIREDVGYHAFDGGDDLVAFDTTFVLAVDEGFDAFLSVPLYTQGDGTSIANLSIGAEFDLAEGTNEFIGEWNLAAGGGLYLPVGSEAFGSSNLDPFVTVEFGCNVWLLDFTQTAEYHFVGGNAYIPWLGAQTESDVLILGSRFAYGWQDFDFAAELTQVYYTDDNKEQVFFGPAVTWNPSSTISLEARIDIPLTQNISAPETDIILGFGIGIDF